MNVLIPSPLLSYTGTNRVEAAGRTMADVLTDLDRQFPGLRFRVIDELDRMRPHMRFFVNGKQVHDIAIPLEPDDSIQIVQALSGG